jgi:CubicO group peptidase (beta-lactamase class C family)
MLIGLARRGRMLAMAAKGIGVAAIAGALAEGCRAEREAPWPAVVPKGPPGSEQAARAVDAFLEAANGGDPAAWRSFYSQYWSAAVPPPRVDERLARRAAEHAALGHIEPLPLTMTAHGVSVPACATRDGWITIDFLFEAAAPHKLVGVRARPAPAPPGEHPCEGFAGPSALGELPSRLDAYIAQRGLAVPFSGVVLIGKDGAPVFAKAYGLADREARIPNAVDTRFNIASTGKTFTAVAVEQLAEAGRLSLGDPVKRWLPSFGPPELGPATLAQLLQHTSGLGDVFGPPFGELRVGLRQPQDFLNAFGNELLEFPPGERARYSNLGYMALGRVVELASGERYEEYLGKHLFEPAGMGSTSEAPYDAPMPGRAQGYTHQQWNGPWTRDERRNDTMNLVAGSPAGCGVSTAPDLLRFAAALTGGKLLPPATFARMTHGEQVLEAPGGVLDGRYGEGFIDEVTAGVRHVGHGGGLPGANAYFEMIPDRGLTIVVLANQDPPKATWIGDRVLTWLVALPP